jgi:glycosyltransferase involved in cell wall biosynthesis
MAAKLFRIEVITDYRDEWEDSMIDTAKSRIYKRSARYLKNFMTRCYYNSDLVVTVTEPLAHSLSLRGVKNVKLVTNGADCSVFKRHNKDASRRKMGFDAHDFIMVYSGVIGGYYRLDVVVRALKKVKEKGYNVKLLMVGSGADLEMTLGLIEQEGLKNNIFYLGTKLDELELAEILSACDIGIIPYDSNILWKNSLPAKALEYFACGLPAIATVYKDSLLGKLIFENGIGMVSDPEDTDALANTVEKIYANNNLMSNGGNKALLLIERVFDRRKIAEEFLSLLPVGRPK